MVELYTNLSEKDVREIKNAYYIPEGDKPLYKKDFDFVIYFKQRVFEVLNNYWKAENTGEPIDYERANKEALVFAGELKDFMTSAEAGNIMRRLIFVQNIDKEFNGAQIALPWLERQYPINHYKKTEPIAKELALFYRYITVNALMKDGFLAKKEQESAMIIAERLKDSIETDFIKKIDKNRMSYSDIFYLMGHFKQQINKQNEKRRKLEDDKCEGCSLDDCMSSHCYTMTEKIEIDSKIKKLEVVYKACIAKAMDNDVTAETRRQIAGIVEDNFLRQIVCNVLDMDTKKVALKKRFVVNWGRERNICIQSRVVTDVLADSISTLKGVDYWRTRDIATGIVLNDYDLAKGTGDKVHDAFVTLFNETNNEVAQQVINKSLTKVNAIKLIEEYKKSKKEDELGGE